MARLLGTLRLAHGILERPPLILQAPFLRKEGMCIFK